MQKLYTFLFLSLLYCLFSVNRKLSVWTALGVRKDSNLSVWTSFKIKKDSQTTIWTSFQNKKDSQTTVWTSFLTPKDSQTIVWIRFGNRKRVHTFPFLPFLKNISFIMKHLQFTQKTAFIYSQNLQLLKINSNNQLNSNNH